MKVLISGSSQGIGLKVAKYFLEKGFKVVGLDLKEANIKDVNYTHYICDIKEEKSLPSLDGINIIFANAGMQNSSDDIDNNLKGTINVVEKYIENNDALSSIVFNASASAVTGSEFPKYAASKAGILGYMKNVAIRLAKKKVTVNAISLGGVNTNSNKAVMEDKNLWNQIMEVTPMKKWMDEEEVAKWIYFLSVENKSCSGQNILIDNGEHDLNDRFVWPN